MKMSKEAVSNIGIIGPVRFSYLNVFKPRMNNMKQPPVLQFSATLMVPKKANQFCPNPVAIIEQIKAMTKAGAELKGVKNPSSPLRDGDTELNNDGEPKFPGYWYITANADADSKLILVNGVRQPVTDGWNSGDWGKVRVAFSGNPKYTNIGVFLQAIQFLHKDEALGGSSASADDFEVVENADGVGVKDDEYDPFADSED
jgi:hypothetical protein